MSKTTTERKLVRLFGDKLTRSYLKFSDYSFASELPLAFLDDCLPRKFDVLPPRFFWNPRPAPWAFFPNLELFELLRFCPVRPRVPRDLKPFPAPLPLRRPF